MQKFKETMKGEWSTKKTVITATSLVLVVAMVFGIVFGIAPNTVLRVSAATGLLESVSGNNNIPNTYNPVNVPAGTYVMDSSGNVKQSEDGLAAFDFHIFADHFASSVHTCGNIAVDELGGSVLGAKGAPEFGSRAAHDLRESRVSYIDKVTDFTLTENYDALVFGDGNTVKLDGERTRLNDKYTLGHHAERADHIYVEDGSTEYIDIDAELSEAEDFQRYLVALMNDVKKNGTASAGPGNKGKVLNSPTLTGSEDRSVRVLDYPDVAGPGNGITIDLGKYKEDTIIIDLEPTTYFSYYPRFGYVDGNEAELLIAGMVKIKGAENKRVIFNVDTQGKDITFPDTNMTADTLKNEEETANKDNNILWNFYDSKNGNGSATSKITVGGTWVGTVLAPQADVVCKAGLNGSIIAKNVSTFNETHKSDYTGEKPKGKTGDIEVTKRWADNPATRPSYVTVRLLQNNKVYKTIQLTGTSEKWTYKFENLPLTDAAGKSFKYKVEEDVPAGYEGTVINYDLTNTSGGTYEEPATYSLTVKKLIDGTSTNLGGAQFRLTSDAGASLAEAKEASSSKSENFKATDKEVTWTSSNDGAAVIENLPAGKYTVTEISAPTGYKLDAVGSTAKVEITTSNASTEIKNKPIEAKFAKLESQNKARLAGAKLTLTSNNGADLNNITVTGATVDSKTSAAINFTSGTSDVVFKSIPAGSYTITETESPEGYDIAAPVFFTVTENGEMQINGNRVSRVEMTDDKTPEVKPEPVYHSITIDKKDNHGNPISGATFTLSNIAGEDISSATVTGADKGTASKNSELVFTTNGNQVTIGHLLAGNYVLTETGVPGGYKPAAPVSITVNSDPSYTEVDNYTVVNEEITFKIAKVDAVSGEYLEGATLKLITSNGSLNFPSRSEEITPPILAVAGNYSIEEVSAPDGYNLLTEPVNFSIDAYGNVTGSTVVSNTVYVYNEPVEISIGKQYSNKGAAGALAGAKLRLTSDKDLSNVTGSYAVTHVDSKTITWESGASDNTLRGLPDGSYTLHEIEAPEGFDVAADVTFTVSGGKITNPASADTDTFTSTDSNVTLIDVKKPVYSLHFGKIKAKDGTAGATEYLSGAKLAVFNEDAKSFIEDEAVLVFESTNGQMHMMLEDGDYVLAELEAPDGYDKTDQKIYFTVKDGILTITKLDKAELAVASYGNPSDNEGVSLDTNCFYTLETTKIFETYGGFPDSVYYDLGKDFKCSNFTLYKDDGKTPVAIKDVDDPEPTVSADGTKKTYSFDLAPIAGEYDANYTYYAVLDIVNNDGTPADPEKVGVINLNFKYPAPAIEGEPTQVETGYTGSIINPSYMPAITGGYGSGIALEEATSSLPQKVSFEFSGADDVYLTSFELLIYGIPKSGGSTEKQFERWYKTGNDLIYCDDNNKKVFTIPSDDPAYTYESINAYDPNYNYFFRIVNGNACGEGNTFPDTVNIKFYYSDSTPPDPLNPGSYNANATTGRTELVITDIEVGTGAGTDPAYINLPNRPSEISHLCSVKLNKKDSKNNTGIPGAKFLLVDSKGDLVEKLVDKGNGIYEYDAAGTTFVNTDEAPLITAADGTLTVKGLDEGHYSFYEIEASEGYVIDEEETDFILNLNHVADSPKQLTVTNSQQTGELIFIKTDDAGVLKEGEKFELHRISLTDGTDTTVTTSEDIITKNDGKYTLKGLEPGYIYYAKELTAAPGTVLDSTTKFPVHTDKSFYFIDKNGNGAVDSDEKFNYGVAIGDNIVLYTINSSATVTEDTEPTVPNTISNYAGTVSAQNEATKTTFSKTDGSALLPGAKLTIVNDNAAEKELLATVHAFVMSGSDLVDYPITYTHEQDESDNWTESISWVSGKKDVVFYGLPADGSFTVVETEAPEGYSVAEAKAVVVGDTNTIVDDILTCDITLSASKAMEGRELKSTDVFTFTLTGDGQNQSKNNNGSVIDFDTISYTYDDIGEHVYTIKETAVNENGVSGDDAEYTVTVNVYYDDADGALKTDVNVEKDGDDASGIIFTNTYASEKAKAQISISKVLNGRDMSAGEFTFILSDSDKNLVDEKTSGAAANGEAATVTFDEIEYTKEGTYTYTVKEVKGSTGGVSYDNTVKTVTVVVTDDGAGKLSAEVTTAASALVFTNTYTASGDAPATVSGTKTLSGRDWTDTDAFVINLTDNTAGTTETATATKANPTYSFTKTYTASDIGKTFTYTIEEAKKGQNENGISYSNDTYTWTVVVTDGGDGTVKATGTLTKGTVTVTSADFTNNYEASGSTFATVEGTKELTGDKVLSDGDFTFVLSGAASDTTVNNDGKFSFTQEYTEAGTYNYTITEQKGGTTEKGITYDGKTYNWQVVVADNGAGGFTVTSNTLTLGTSAVSKAAFINAYNTTPTTATIEATKTLEGMDLTSGMFSFELLDASGTKIGDAVSNDAAGKISFPALTFNKAGTYNYTIREVIPATPAGGMSYDTSKAVQVVVTDNGDGTLTAVVSKSASELVFENTYTTGKIFAAIEAKKTLNGGRAIGENEFSFSLYKSSDLNNPIDTVFCDTSGNVSFKAIEYDKEGEYDYVIKENDTGLPGVTYDDDAEEVTVTVTDNKDGTLSAVVSKSASEIVFENGYSANGTDATVNGMKTLSGADLEKDDFTFVLYDKTGTTELGRTTNEANGTFSFTKSFDTVGEYEYTIKELNAAADGIVYDTTEYSWKVSVTDPGNGQLTASGKLNKSGDSTALTVALFNNETTKVIISKKALGGTGELAGAHLVITDSAGSPVADWTSTGTAKVINGLAAGTYTLTETTAPSGYEIASPITFTIEADGTVKIGGTAVDDKTVTMTDDTNSLVISKKAVGGTDELSGADLVLYKADSSVYTSWTSDGSTKVIRNIPDGIYTLSETTAPDRYALAENIVIKVENGSIYAVAEDDYKGVDTVWGSAKSGDIVTMYDAPNSVSISKKAVGGTVELANAKLVVTDSKGNEVASWTSTGTAKVINGLAAGTYTLTETEAPAGYAVAAPITFTVEANNVVKVNGTVVDDNTVTMYDAGNSFSVSKKAVGGKDELTGAMLAIKDSTGKELTKWTSADTCKVIEGLSSGTYTLVETSAPSGYTIAEPITFTIEADGSIKYNGTTAADKTVVMLDAPTKVYISKVDATNSEELSGADLTIKDEKGNEVAKWTSGKTRHEIEKLPVGTYTLTEVTAPDGYAVAETITFKIDKDGSVLVKDGSEFKTVDDKVVVMKDAPTCVTISKVDMAGGEELSGADLIVRDSKGNEVAKWTSGKTKHEIKKLPAGTYTLTEITAPDGYKVAETITFKMEPDGKVTVNGVVVNDNNVVMKDAPNALILSKQAVGGGKELEGASLTLTAVSGTDLKGYTAPEGVTLKDKTISWTSGSKPVTLNKIPDGIYSFTEVTAPKGYDIAETIYIKVANGKVYSVASKNYKGADTIWGNPVSNDTVVMFDTLTPEPAETNFSFTKYNNVDASLSGAKFKLTGNNGYSQEATSSSTGEVYFYGMKEGTYTLTETEAPKGHVKTTATASVIVDSNGEKTYFDASGNQISLATIEGLMKNSIIPVYDEEKGHEPGDKVDLYEKLTKDHEEYADIDITWVSSDESVATVDKYGKVTFKKPGEVTIVAKAGDVELGSFVLGASDNTPNVTPSNQNVTPNVTPNTGDNDTPVTGDSIFWSVIATIVLALSTVTMIVIRRKSRKERRAEGR